MTESDLEKISVILDVALRTATQLFRPGRHFAVFGGYGVYSSDARFDPANLPEGGLWTKEEAEQECERIMAVGDTVGLGARVYDVLNEDLMSPADKYCALVNAPAVASEPATS